MTEVNRVSRIKVMRDSAVLARSAALRKALSCFKALFACACFGAGLSVISLTPIGNAHAQGIESDWWFDIEFIAFKRELLPNHPEDFTQGDFDFADALTFDLMTLELLKRANPNFRILANINSCDNPSMPAISFAETAPIPLTEVLKDAQSFIDIKGLLEPTQQDSIDAIDTSAPAIEGALNFFIASQSWLNQETAISMDDAPNLLCVDTPEYDTFTSVEQAFFSNSAYQLYQHSLLEEQGRYLNSYAKRVFAQRDILPLIYTAWRQPVVFGEDEAAFYRVFGGARVSPEQTNEALAQSSLLEEEQAEAIDESQLINTTLAELEALETALSNPEPVLWKDSQQAINDHKQAAAEIAEQWELDGLFKVYLDYVNRVPYLHIDSQFKHVRLDINEKGQADVESYHSKQRRRIISKQIHYFDHPAFGIIVRLERFEMPPQDEEQD
jgi:hypothetical protein